MLPQRSTHRGLPDDGLVKPKHVGAFIVTFNVNFNILKQFNPLNAELNPICHLLALLGAHLIFHVSRIRVKY
jgi:hypothetical protein